MRPVAFITGASRGIGRGIALDLAANGWNIVAAATKADPNNTESGNYEVKARVEERGGECLPIAGNVANLDDHPRMIREALDHFGGIDLLVNNAGVAPLERKDLLECTPESYDRVMDINLRGPYFLTQRVANYFLEERGKDRPGAATIIFITSISSDTASDNRVEYCVSKAGLAMTAQSYAVRLAPHGINVYDVRPGITATDMTAAVKEKYDKLINEGLLLQPRWGTPEDVGKAVTALARGDFAYAPGAVVTLDGGMGLKRL
jgi:NAD(P)-dependent dehydrogenase (short-subunit alcohol dehydrogenase family)